MDNYNERSIGIGRILFYGAIAMSIAVGIAFVALFFIFFGTYNNLIDMRENVRNAEADVEAMMQRRLEIIPDIVSSIESYTQHEENVIQEIANARKALSDSLGIGDIKKISEANEQVTVALDNFVTLVEDNPDLTSGEQYSMLIDNIERSANRITIARENYNEEVSNYNKAIKHFPAYILAGLFNFEEEEMFEADKEASNPNLVNFD